MRVARKVFRFLRNFLYEQGVLPISKPGLSNDLLVPQLKFVITKYEIDTVIDVGANIGQFAHRLKSRVMFEGEVHCFEPDPRLISKLMAFAKRENNIVVHNLGLARKSGSLVLNIAEISTLNSFLPPSQEGIDVGQFRDIVEQTVEVTTLDKFISGLSPDGGRKRSILLKIDTQGFDLEVLAGLQDHVAHVKAILIEAAFQRIYDNAPVFTEVFEALDQKGFAFAGMPETNHAYDVVIDADCLFLRKDILPGFQAASKKY